MANSNKLEADIRGAGIGISEPATADISFRLNGINYDKWERIYLKKLNIKKWAGAYAAKSAPLQEFPAQLDLNLNCKFEIANMVLYLN